MSHWTETDRRIRIGSAAGRAGIALVYVSTGIIGLLAGPPDASLLQQFDPYLAVMEILMILFAANLVAIQASVHAFALEPG